MIELREQYPLAIAASIIVISFAVVVYFVTLGIYENKTSDQERDFQYIIDNASVVVKTTQSKTKQEIIQFLNATKDRIDNSQEIQKFQQLIENKEKENVTKNKP